MWRSFCLCNVWSQVVDLQHAWGETPPKWQKIIFDNFVNIIPHSQLYFWRKNYVPLSHHMGRLITMGLFIFVMSPPWLLYKALPFLRRKVHMGLWPSALSYILLLWNWWKKCLIPYKHSLGNCSLQKGVTTVSMQRQHWPPAMI